MRVLVIHNQLWAHYKSKLFTEINNSLKEISPESDFSVIHIALHEASRGAMQDQGNFRYDYPYKVLFNTSLDQVKFKERFFALLKAFNEYKPTVLNITGYFDWAQVLLMIYAKRKGVKIVLSSESSSADNNRSKVKEAIKRWILSHADIFFCFGKSSADYLISLGVKPMQIAVKNAAVVDEEMIRNSYDHAKQQVERGKESLLIRKNFVFVGRLAPEKNLERLIKAFAELQNSELAAQSWDLVFVGDGPLRKSLETQASESANPDHIQFAGGHPWFKVPEWLAKSDILVLPSLSEPWGLVVNEAMVCGMPVIVSTKCGCADDLLKNGVNGFSFNPESRDELKNALLFFINHPDKIDIMGAQSESLVRPFQSKNVAREMVKSYINL